MKRLALAWIAILSISLLSLPLVAAQTSPCARPVTVWDNDTLASIAQKNGVQVADLAAKNGLAPNARLLIGQVLCLDNVAAAPTAAATTPAAPNPGTGGPIPTSTPSPAATTTATASPTTSAPLPPAPTSTASPVAAAPVFLRGQTGVPAGYTTYNVAEGDNLFGISQKTGASVTQISQANNITNLQVVYLGETLLIPPRSTTGVVPTASPVAPNPGTGGALPTATATPVTSVPANVVHRPLPGTIPSLALPAQGQLGAAISLSGSNYPGNTVVNIFVERPSLGLRSASIGQATTLADGTFTAQVTLPSVWANGQAISQNVVSLSAYTVTGGYWAMNTLVITNPSAAAPLPTATPTAVVTATSTPGSGTGGALPPTATASPAAVVFRPAPGTLPLITLPARARPGDSITVTGSNYPGNTRVLLYVERPSFGLKSAVLAEVTTQANGTFSTTLTVPSTWPNNTPLNQNIISVSGYTQDGVYWGMNYFVNG